MKKTLSKDVEMRATLDSLLPELATAAGIRFGRDSYDYDLVRVRAAFYEGRYHRAAEILEAYAEHHSVSPEIWEKVMEVSAPLHTMESTGRRELNVRYYPTDRGTPKSINVEYNGIRMEGHSFQVLDVTELSPTLIVVLTRTSPSYHKMFQVQIMDSTGSDQPYWQSLRGQRSWKDSDNFSSAINTYHKMVKENKDNV
jgi:hypothetical protein